MSEAENCVIGSKPHMADSGYLCSGHAQKLADTLRELEDEYALLSAVPSMMIRSGRGGSLASHRSPAVLDVLVATDRRRGTGHIGSDAEDPWGLDDTASVLDVLHSWARVVREERGLAAPQQVTVSGERDLLTRHLPWVAGQAWVDDAYGELRALLGQLKATNGTAEVKPTARCHLPAADGSCGGDIRVDDGYAYCGKCGETWTNEQACVLLEQIHALSRPLTDDGRAMMTVAELVVRFGGNANSVRVRLSRAGIRGVDGYYDTAAFEGVVA